MTHLFTLSQMVDEIGCKMPVFANPALQVLSATRFLNEIQEGSLFIDITREGEQFFSKDDIINANPIAILTSRVDTFKNVSNIQILNCLDCIEAIGKLACFHRKKFKKNTIGITGSTGKTTTAAIISHLLSSAGSAVLDTERNENDEIGVPIKIFQLKEHHDFIVLEMGTWRAGEILFLAKTAQPNIGVVTNIGWSHFSRFGSIDNIVSAKCELIKELPTEGLAVLNKDDLFFEKIASCAKCNIICFSIDKLCDIQLIDFKSLL